MTKGSAGQTDNIKLAVSAIILSVLSLSFGDAIIKMMSINFSLWQLYVVRSAIALPVIYALLKLSNKGNGTVSLVPLAPGWAVLRSLLLALMWIAYYAALPHIELSVAAAMYYTAPLFITMFSAFFTGDKVTARSWMAIALGFAGVLIIVKPQSDSFSGYVLLPLLSAFLYALSMILTRTHCRYENPWVLTLSLNVTFILVGLIATALLPLLIPQLPLEYVDQTHSSFLFGQWSLLDTKAWLALATLAAVAVSGSVFAAIAYQQGTPAVVATFDYSYLAFSAMWGFIFFTELPDMLTMFGMLLIVSAGVIALKVRE